MRAQLKPRIDLDGRTPLETVIPLATPFIVFVDPAKREFRVPAFWAGGKIWRVRYSSATPKHTDRVKPFEDYCIGLISAEGRTSVDPLAAMTAPERARGSEPPRLRPRL